MSTSKCKELVVVAIDVGTTYSGYAYSFKTQYDEKPTNISVNQAWMSGSKELISLKTPTVLLLKWDEDEQRFIEKGFGFNAENKYQQLMDDDNHRDYYLVRSFKMDLYNRTAFTGLNRDSVVPVCRGKDIKLAELFCMAISSLKNHFLKTIKKREAVLLASDIRWMLTVPAIWTDGAKQIMIEAAVEAGIMIEKLSIVLEPEAASLYCMHLPSLTAKKTTKLSEGTKYIVIDAGGGTVDITVHQVQSNGALLEIHAASGGPWGGTMVDAKFIKILTDIIGQEVFETFSEIHREDLFDLYREFEHKKRNFDVDREKESLRLPVSLAKTYLDIRRKPISVAFLKSNHKEEVVKVHDKMKISSTFLQGFFQESCDNIIMHVKELLEQEACDGISTILLVGAYAESPILQKAFETHFEHLQIVIPEEAGLAVLKGAVLYGHNPSTIISRVAQFSYGIQTTKLFREGIHPEDKKLFCEGVARCSDVFNRHITKGQDLKRGEPQIALTYSPLYSNATKMTLTVYRSTSTEPAFVTEESCTYIGELTVEITQSSGGEKEFEVSLDFDGLMHVTAVEKSTNKTSKAYIDFLQKFTQPEQV